MHLLRLTNSLVSKLAAVGALVSFVCDGRAETKHDSSSPQQTLKHAVEVAVQWPDSFGLKLPSRNKDVPQVSPALRTVEAAIEAVRTFLASKNLPSSAATLTELTRRYEQVSARIEANQLLRIPRAYMGGGVRFDSREWAVSGTVPKAMWGEIAREAEEKKSAENNWRADFHLWQWGLERLQTALLLDFATGAANVGRSDAALEPELRRLLATEGAKDEVVTSMISMAKKQGNWYMR